MTPEALKARRKAESNEHCLKIMVGMDREAVNPKRRAKKADGLSHRQRKRLRMAHFRKAKKLKALGKNPFSRSGFVRTSRGPFDGGGGGLGGLELGLVWKVRRTCAEEGDLIHKLSTRCARLTIPLDAGARGVWEA